MKFNKFSLVVLLFVVVTAIRGESELLDQDTVLNVENALMQSITTVATLLFPMVPVGPILCGAIGMLHVATMIMSGGEEQASLDEGKALTTIDMMKLQNVMVDEMKRLDTQMKIQSDKIINGVVTDVKFFMTENELRKSAETLQQLSADKMRLLMNSKLTGKIKNETIDHLLDFESTYMLLLRRLVENYIATKSSMPATGKTDLIFELILQKHALLASKFEDDYTESLHSKIFKTFIYLAKVLTEGYVPPIIAHTLQYISEIKRGLITDAHSTKINADVLIENYKSNIRDVIDKTKWALDNAPREVKNSAAILHVKGKTFERPIFAQTIARVFYRSQNGCKEESIVDLQDYELGNCNTYGDIIPPGSQISLFYDPTDERPIHYMKVMKADGYEDKYGHNSTNPNLLLQQTVIHQDCPTVFCPAFKKNAVAISTQKISADYGHAITGLRFREHERIIYIDIQQAKYIDIMTANPDVSWKKTPPGGPVTYISLSQSKIEVGDFELVKDVFLKELWFKPNPREGIFKICASGVKSDGSSSFDDYCSSSKITNEISYTGDDPEEADLENFNVLPVPKNERSYISLHPSGLSEDMGRTNIGFDIREVVTYPPAPISGFGIYLTSLNVLGLKLITPVLDHKLDFTPFFNSIDSVKLT